MESGFHVRSLRSGSGNESVGRTGQNLEGVRDGSGIDIYGRTAQKLDGLTPGPESVGRASPLMVGVGNQGGTMEEVTGGMEGGAGMEGYGNATLTAGLDDVEQNFDKHKTFLQVLNNVNEGRNATHVRGQRWEQVLRRVEVQTDERGRNLIPGSIAERGITKWKNTLIGVVLGRRIPLNIIEKNVRRMWSRWGMLEVGYTGVGMVYIRFSNDKGFEEILQKSDWSIVGCPFLLRRWSAGLTYDAMESASLHLWVRMYNAPFEYLHVEGIEYMASIVGIPLKIDMGLLNRGVVRVLVEAEANEPLKEVLLMSSAEGKDFDVKLEFEYTPPLCLECKVFGYKADHCPKMKRRRSGEFDTGNDQKDWRVVEGKDVLKNKSGNKAVSADTGSPEKVEGVKSSAKERFIKQGNPSSPCLSSNQFALLQDDDKEVVPSSFVEVPARNERQGKVVGRKQQKDIPPRNLEKMQVREGARGRVLNEADGGESTCVGESVDIVPKSPSGDRVRAVSLQIEDDEAVSSPPRVGVSDHDRKGCINKGYSVQLHEGMSDLGDVEHDAANTRLHRDPADTTKLPVEEDPHSCGHNLGERSPRAFSLENCAMSLEGFLKEQSALPVRLNLLKDVAAMEKTDFMAFKKDFVKGFRGGSYMGKPAEGPGEARTLAEDNRGASNIGNSIPLNDNLQADVVEVFKGGSVLGESTVEHPKELTVVAGPAVSAVSEATKLQMEETGVANHLEATMGQEVESIGLGSPPRTRSRMKEDIPPNAVQKKNGRKGHQGPGRR